MRDIFPALLKKRSYIFVLTILISIGCYFLIPSQENLELQSAYKEFATIQTNSWLILDTTSLATVATGDVLEFNTKAIEELKEQNITYLFAEQTRIAPIIGFKILAYTDTRAVVRVIQRTVSFSQNPETGERSYSTTPRWYAERVVMVKEDGRWKIKRIELIRVYTGS